MGKCAFWAFFAGLLLARAHAATGPLPDISGATDKLEAMAPDLVKTIGIAFDHRPYQPATPLGTAAGVDISLEATLSKAPQGFKDALTEAGFGGAAALPVLPSPKLHLHKGMGDDLDIGGSLIFYKGYKVFGGDIKIALTDPTLEGPMLAGRLSLNYSNFSYVTATTWTPQLLISRKMTFADPYLGIGYQYVTGEIELALPLPDGVTAEQAEAAGIPTTVGPYPASGGAFQAFFGVSFRPPNLGLKLVMEGSYCSYGAHALGIKFGFAF